MSVCMQWLWYRRLIAAFIIKIVVSPNVLLWIVKKKQEMYQRAVARLVVTVKKAPRHATRMSRDKDCGIVLPGGCVLPREASRHRSGDDKTSRTDQISIHLSHSGRQIPPMYDMIGLQVTLPGGSRMRFML